MSRIFALAVFLTLFAPSSHAQTLEQMIDHARHHAEGTVPACTEKPSEWGYRHRNCIDDKGNLQIGLHESGAIDEMREKSGQSCCSHEYQGECRGTEVKMREREVLIDGYWRPIGPYTKIVKDMEKLPDGVQAVVCARNAMEGPFCVGLTSGQ